MCIYVLNLYVLYVSITSIVFWFDSLSLQTFGVVSSKYSSPEISKLQEPADIITPSPSVSQLSLKAEVKDISYLPVLHYQSETGQFLDTDFTSLFKKYPAFAEENG